MNKKVVIISGYFDVPHSQHMVYAENARNLAGEDGLVYCIVNNDRQAKLKKGYSFIPENDRLAVMSANKNIDKAFLSIDDDRTVCKTIQYICDTETFKPTIVFNEGDVTENNPCPEEAVCKQNNISMVYGKSPKLQSSSWIISNSVKSAYEALFPSK